MDKRVRLVITLKNSVLDPQGEAVTKSLSNLGFNNVKNVRIGKVIDLELSGIPDGGEEINLENLASSMAEKLLCNMVMENFAVEIKSSREIE